MKLIHFYKAGFGQEDAPREIHAEDSYRFEPHPYGLRQSDDVTVLVKFDRFGPKQNPRDYEVEVTWSDMKWLLEQFVASEHPHADHLMRILKLVRTLDDSGWRDDREPPDFWEDILSD